MLLMAQMCCQWSILHRPSATCADECGNETAHQSGFCCLLHLLEGVVDFALHSTTVITRYVLSAVSFPIFRLMSITVGLGQWSQRLENSGDSSLQMQRMSAAAQQSCRSCSLIDRLLNIKRGSACARVSRPHFDMHTQNFFDMQIRVTERGIERNTPL